MNWGEYIPLFDQAGAFVFPLYIGSMLTLAIALEKLWHFRRAYYFPLESMLPTIQAIREGDSDRQLELVALGGVPANIIQSWRHGIEVVLVHFQMETEKAQTRLRWLSVIAAVAPLLGLLGTVTGLIQSFGVLAAEGVDPQSLAGGINVALYSTALGLVTAMPALVAYRFLQSYVSKIVERVDIVLEALTEPRA